MPADPVTGTETCCNHGPGYATPMDAYKNGPREKLLYVTCVRRLVQDKPDYLSTVDVDPESPTYSQIIHRLELPYKGDEVHHTGWNACSSCYDDPTKKRAYLVLPCLESDRIYIIDTTTDPLAPRIHRVIEPEEVHEKAGVTLLHSSHCLPSGHVMVSGVGSLDGVAKGSFVMVQGSDFTVSGNWCDGGQAAPYGYDFWYQPHFNVMISTEWGHPRLIRDGFNPQHVADGKYGQHLNVWDWTTHELLDRIDLGPEGLLPMEIRFLHNPDEPQGYVGCALGSTIYRFFRTEEGKWAAEKAIDIGLKKVENWILPDMPAVNIEILISLDDRFLYVTNYLFGDVRQYDITDRKNPKMTGQVYVGGLISKDLSLKVVGEEQPEPTFLRNGTRVQGGAHMLQLSLDGKRLYVTTSLISCWDNQFYPELIKKGGAIMLIDVDTEKGGLTLNKDFGIDMGAEPDGPALAHEMRYPGGDCTSDIWI